MALGYFSIFAPFQCQTSSFNILLSQPCALGNKVIVGLPGSPYKGVCRKATSLTPRFGVYDLDEIEDADSDGVSSRAAYDDIYKWK